MGPSKPQTTQTNQTQSSTTQPWAAALPGLQSLIGDYSGLSPSVTPEQTAALSSLTSEAGGVPSYDTSKAISDLLSSSTTPQVGMLTDTLNNTNASLDPLTDPGNLNPNNTPGFSDALKTMTNDITNSVKGVYAGSGRDPSGAGSFAGSLGRGLVQGEAPVIAQQYNSNVSNLENAVNAKQTAGLTTAGAITGQKQVPLSNEAQAVGLVPAQATAEMTPGQAQLGAASTSYQTPYTNLAALLQPFLSLGSLGTQSSGTGSSTSTQTPASNTSSNILGGLLGGTGILSNLGAFGSSGFLTGSGGLLSSLAPMLALSDERSKEDIEKVGELDDGQNVYRFKYKGAPGTHIGLLAQEVEEHEPEAVHELPGIGLLAVDYHKATERASHMRRAA